MNKDWSHLLTSTFGWVRANLHHFRLRDSDDRTRQIDLLKPLGELALTCGVLSRSPSEVQNSSVHEIIEWCWSELDDGNFLADVIRNNPELIVLASIYATFYESGFRNLSVENEVRFAFSMQGVRALEFPAWRRLDVLTAMSRIDIKHNEEMSDLIGRTWLGARPEPWMLSDGAAYSVTHTVFYVTDFGRFPDALPRQYVDYLVRWVPAWISYYGRVDNLDILSEFLMVRRCLAQDNPQSWCDLLSQRQAANGSIPGPRHGGQVLMIGETDDERRTFFRDYHTTLVTAMAAAMSNCRAVEL